MSSTSYEVALFGQFFSPDLKTIINRITLNSESSRPFHAREIILEPLEREAGQDPVLLRARKELDTTDGESVGWVLYSYLKPESVRIHPEATVRPWATCHVTGDALSFASALGYKWATPFQFETLSFWHLHRQRSQIYKKGFTFLRGPLLIQLFQQSTNRTTPESSTLWEVEVKTAKPIKNTQETPLGLAVEAVLEVQALMKGLLDLRRQDIWGGAGGCRK